MVKTSKNHVKSYLAVLVTALMLMSVVAPAMTVSASSDLYSSTESFSSFAIVDGTMTSDTGNATITFTNDATNGAGTFENLDNIRLQVNQKATYDPDAATKTTSSDAKMVYTLPEAVSGKVQVSFQAWLKSGFSWVDAFTFMEAKDSKGNNLLNIGYEANNLYMGGRWDSVENRCTVTGCTTTSGTNQTHMNASNFVGGYRTARFIFDFDKGTITFYRGDAEGNVNLLEHNGHAYTLAIQNNAEDLKSLVFNFKGGCTAAETTTTYSSAIVLDDLVVRQIVDPVWSMNITDGDNQVDPKATQPIMTFNTALSVTEATKIKFYKSGELVEDVATLSEDGKTLTFTESLDYSTVYAIELPAGVLDEQVLELTPGTVSFHTMHEPSGVAPGAVVATIGTSPVIGKDLSAATPGETFVVSVPCTGTAGKQVTLIAVFYRAGMMVDIEYQTLTIPASGSATPEVCLTIPDNTTGLTYETFLWENYTTMKLITPYSE